MTKPVANAAGAKAEVVVPEPGPENLVEFRPPPLPSTLPDEAFEMWSDIWEVGHGFYVPATDHHIIERYVALQMRRRHLLDLLEEEGYVTTGSQGQDVAHPGARLLLDIEGKLGPMEDRLGLSPEARIRLGLAAAETKSKLDAFFED